MIKGKLDKLEWTIISLHTFLSFFNPGIIYPKIDFMQLLECFEPEALCLKCKIIRTNRSQHCHFCKKCIEFRIHHCPWLNNCIGKHNLVIYAIYLAILWIYLVSEIFSSETCIFLKLVFSYFCYRLSQLIKHSLHEPVSQLIRKIRGRP